METPGERIRRARQAQGWDTYRKADRATGISRDNWANWEIGRVLPSWDSLKRLAEALQVSEVWLLSGQGDGPDHPVPTEPAPDDPRGKPSPRSKRSGKREAN